MHQTGNNASDQDWNILVLYSSFAATCTDIITLKQYQGLNFRERNGSYGHGWHLLVHFKPSELQKK